MRHGVAKHSHFVFVAGEGLLDGGENRRPRSH
jgi:hypothetical protein